jgi:hypothetical protein
MSRFRPREFSRTTAAGAVPLAEKPTTRAFPTRSRSPICLQHFQVSSVSPSPSNQILQSNSASHSIRLDLLPRYLGNGSAADSRRLAAVRRRAMSLLWFVCSISSFPANRGRGAAGPHPCWAEGPTLARPQAPGSRARVRSLAHQSGWYPTQRDRITPSLFAGFGQLRDYRRWEW